jgi:hypothetical protein
VLAVCAASLRRAGARITEERMDYWFPAKRYGWGWGLPVAWQGWVVLGIFVVLLAAGALMLLPSHGPIAFVAYVIFLCVCLTAVCWTKGEAPRWRWGGDD